MLRLWLIISLLLGAVQPATAQERLGIAFYDVDNLYDTIPSRFYNDRDYTPSGRLRWDTERYRHKVKRIAGVVDSLSMPIIVLYGVESEAVVRDIAEACHNDYSYIHRTNDGSDGLDFAMLYYADWFIPEHITAWRGALCIEGSVRSRPLTIVGLWRSTSVGVLLDECGMLDERGMVTDDRNVVVLGRPSANPPSRYGLRDMALAAERRGRGNVATARGWTMRDRVWTNVPSAEPCEVYASEWLMGRDARPAKSSDRARYYGGYSSALPVFIYFDKMFAY